jgi:PAS domain S-box-containing protein
MKEMTGISRSKMIGKGDFEYSLPFFGDRRPLLIDLVFASEEKKMEYYDSVSKVGGSIVAESYAPETYGGKGAYLWGAATALFDDQGNVTGAIETMRDITERKQAQDELFNSRQMLRSVFDNIPQRVFWKDRSSVFVGCNKSLALDAGYKDPSELVGKTDYEHASAATADRYRADDREVMESGRSKLNYEEPQIRPDGSQAWLITSKVPMYDQDGQVIGVLGTYSDITERKLAEDALRESEERFSRFFRSTPVGTSITRLSDGQFMDANDAFLGLSGYTREETVGHSALELGLWANTEDRSKMLKTLEEQGRLQDFETLFRRKSGEIMDVLISAEVMEMAGQQYMLGLTHDITERKRGEEERKKLEEQLFQAQKIESVGRLAGGVAHDFNNMLGVIIGRAEMALGQDVSPDKLQHHLEEILKAGLRSAALTRQLLAFARKQTAVAKILHLNDTISGMLKMLRRLIGEDIDLLWVPGLDLWNVKIDPSQVDQILANLVVNARDAISGVGAVTMRTENVVIDDSKRAETLEFIPGEYVLLTVSDTGTGMSREVCEMIFEPFFTTKEMGKGTGLGLSTVYGIVKQNDGFICVASEPGKGTTFKIYLPRFEVETEQVPSEEITVKRLTGTETILLVEDDEAILDLGKTILENLGYTVLAAQAPADSIRIAEEHPGDIHLLITDVVMPEMNGRELAEQLSTIRPNLECLYMSGYTADVMAHRGILDKGLNFIQKPFGSDDLAVRVRQVLDHLE